MEAYITRRQNTIAQYITIRPILELCEEVERQKGARVSKRRWGQEGINLAGAWASAATTAAETEGTEMGETDN